MDSHPEDGADVGAGGDDEQFLNVDEVAEMIPLDENDQIDNNEENDEAGEGDGDEETESDDALLMVDIHTDSVYSVACGSHFGVSGDGADRAYQWDLLTGEKKFEFLGHTDSVTSCDINSDESLVLTGSMDGTIRLWRSIDGKLHRSLSGPSGDIEFARFHPSGPAVLAGDSDGLVWLWSAQSGELIHTLAGHEGAVTVGNFSGDGKLIVTGDDKGSIIAWTPKTGQPAQKYQKLHASPITALAVHPTQRTALTGAEDGSIALINLDTGRTMHKVNDAHSESVESVAFAAPEFKLCATASVDGAAHVWDLNTGLKRLSVSHSDSVTSLIFHSTLPIFFTSSADGKVRGFDARTGEMNFEKVGHHAPILCFALSKDGKKLVSGADDHLIGVFDATVNQE